MSALVLLENDQLRILVDPMVGGTIRSVEHRGLGLSVLGQVPWKPEATPLDPSTVKDERLWLTRYSGGWPILFPNGGDACTFHGVFHGFHGEASIAPWDMQMDDRAIILRRRFQAVPVEMEREITLDGDVLLIRETARVVGTTPATVMWGHHPSFGSDLLDGPVEIQSNAHAFMSDDHYDAPANPLRPGGKGRWPMVPSKSKHALFDLSRPREPLSALTCLSDFSDAWVTIRRLDDAVGIALSWDETVFPYAWLWFELGGIADEPWNGKTKLIGVEPNTTWPANGLAEAEERGGRLLTLVPGKDVTAEVRLHVFKPAGAVRAVNPDGRVMS
jgi:galactose mutarotase-like enzyme